MDNLEMEAMEREVYCSSWGYAKKGQLGNFKHSNSTTNPVLIEIGNTLVSDAAAGENHCIFTDSQTLYGCGSNTYGQLGIGEEEKRYKVFHQVKNLSGKNFEMLACGAEHSFALTTKGEVYSWGLNFKGQLGSGNFDNRYEPELIENLLPSEGRTMSSSKSNMFFMKRSTSREQMKNKTQASKPRPSKSQAPDDRSGGEYKDLKPSKSVDFTGKKNNGEEGYGDPTTDSVLTQNEKVIQISCGAIHSMVLTNLNRVLS